MVYRTTSSTACGGVWGGGDPLSRLFFTGSLSANCHINSRLATGGYPADFMHCGYPADLLYSGCPAGSMLCGCPADFMHSGCPTDFMHSGCPANLLHCGCSAISARDRDKREISGEVVGFDSNGNGAERNSLLFPLRDGMLCGF